MAWRYTAVYGTRAHPTGAARGSYDTYGEAIRALSGSAGYVRRETDAATARKGKSATEREPIIVSTRITLLQQARLRAACGAEGCTVSEYLSEALERRLSGLDSDQGEE